MIMLVFPRIETQERRLGLSKKNSATPPQLKGKGIE